MERDTSRVYDVITTRLTMTYPACRSQRRRSVETNEQTAARLWRHSVIMRVVSAVVRLSSRPIVDGLLIADGRIVVALLKLPASGRR